MCRSQSLMAVPGPAAACGCLVGEPASYTSEQAAGPQPSSLSRFPIRSQVGGCNSDLPPGFRLGSKPQFTPPGRRKTSFPRERGWLSRDHVTSGLG